MLRNFISRRSVRERLRRQAGRVTLGIVLDAIAMALLIVLVVAYSSLAALVIWR